MFLDIFQVAKTQIVPDSECPWGNHISTKNCSKHSIFDKSVIKLQKLATKPQPSSPILNPQQVSDDGPEVRERLLVLPRELHAQLPAVHHGGPQQRVLGVNHVGLKGREMELLF